MEDLLIKGGTVVDGTGAPAFMADVRVRGGRIAEVAAGIAPSGGERVFDAKGAYVTPGFIDCHTHYDGVMWWQPTLDPLPAYGSTSAIMGNCGFSAAPISRDPRLQEEMINIFSFFEDIPKGPFTSVVPWDWSDWREYRASLDKGAKVAANIGAFVGHIALRLYVMGMDAWERAATPEEIQRMAATLDDALAAGSLGLSSNFMDMDQRDRPVPSRLADEDEIVALLDVIARHPGAVFQFISDVFIKRDGITTVRRMAELCHPRGVRGHYLAMPTRARDADIAGPLMELHEQFKRDGVDFWPAFACSPPTHTISIERTLLFVQTGDFVWNEVVECPDEGGKLALLRDPDWRARARQAWDALDPKMIQRNPERMELRNSDNGHGPVNLTVRDLAEQRGVHASDALADWLIDNGVRSTIHMASPAMDEDMVIRLVKDPQTVAGANDAGAHGQMFCGGGDSMYLFSHYVRERGVLTVEEVVHALTGKVARHFSLADRGVIAPGAFADLTVFALEDVERRDEMKTFDVPDDEGGTTWRYTRPTAPMKLTVVGGTVTFEGDYTGSLPGVVISPAQREVLKEAAE